MRLVRTGTRSIVALAALAVIGWWAITTIDARSDVERRSADRDADVDQTPPAPTGSAAATRAEVTRQADGDSFDVRWLDPRPDGVDRSEVRLRGVNAPERGACYAAEASNELAALLGGGEVRIAAASEWRDDFGRIIADVWTLDGRHVNLLMIERGAALAQRDDNAPSTAAMVDAQESAQANGLGLWSTCVAATSIRIVDVVADAPGRDDTNPNGEWIEITNQGGVAVDLSGWGIRDESTRHRFVFPDGIELAPQSNIRIRSGCAPAADATPGDLHWCADGPVWNNGGDTAFVTDRLGRFVDQRSYGR